MDMWNDFLNSIKRFSRKLKNEEHCEHKKRSCVMVDNDRLLLISNEKYVTSKCLENKYGLDVYAVSNKDSEQKRRLSKEYGFRQVLLEKVDIIPMIKSFCHAARIAIRNDVDGIFKFEIDGVECGDLIYDSIIMREHRYTVNSFRSKIAFREIALMYYIYYEYKKLFNKLNPKYFIAQDLVYRDGFAARYAIKRGIKTILLTTGRPSHLLTDLSLAKFPRLYEKDIKDCIEFLPEDWQEITDERLNKLFSGEGDWNAKNAYMNKRVSSEKEMLEDLGISNNNKKNVFIMAHCFSDAPHGNGGQLYKDYYTWLCETLKLASSIDSVNWLLKLHPSRYRYGEEGAVEELFSKYGNDNINIFPDEYSTLMVKKIADCVITVNGSAGLELTCAGIPCITAGTPFYSGFGYTITPSSIAEYESIIKKIDKIEPMNDEQIRLAKKVYYGFTKVFHADDAYSKECYMIHQNYCVDKNVDKANQKYMEVFKRIVDDDAILNSYNYRTAMEL